MFVYSKSQFQQLLGINENDERWKKGKLLDLGKNLKHLWNASHTLF